jgi:steroid 5-alpha reductase family enzyme
LFGSFSYAVIIACPFYWLDSLTGVDGFYVIADMMIALGYIGECVSDYQLRQFQLRHPKQVCQIGLWRYSRHPNCFFDWLIWLGFAVAVIGQPMVELALLSPILLGYLMIKVTIPMTDRASLKSRGKKYQSYQDKTPIFFPWVSKDHR